MHAPLWQVNGATARRTTMVFANPQSMDPSSRERASGHTFLPSVCLCVPQSVQSNPFVVLCTFLAASRAKKSPPSHHHALTNRIRLPPFVLYRGIRHMLLRFGIFEQSAGSQFQKSEISNLIRLCLDCTSHAAKNSRREGNFHN